MGLGYPHFDNLNLDGFMTYNSLKSYARSKLAVMLCTYEQAKRFKDSNNNNITIYAVHPGVVYTDLIRHFSWILKVLASTLHRLFAISAEMGAQTTLHCAFSEEADKESGLYYS